MLKTEIREAYLQLGEDTDGRAQIAYEIMAKALNTSRLVRVQRPVQGRNGTYMAGRWVRPEQVKRGDRVVGNHAVYESWKKTQDAKPAKTQTQKPAGKPEGTSPAGEKKSTVNPMKKLAQWEKKNAKKQSAKPKPKPEAQPSPKPDAKPTPKPESRQEPKPAPKTETKPKTDTAPAPKLKAESKKESGPVPAPEPKKEPEAAPAPEFTEEKVKEVLEKYGAAGPSAYKSYKLSIAVNKAMPEVYREHGRDGVIKMLTFAAAWAYPDPAWMERFRDTKSGFTPELIAYALNGWIGILSGSIRAAEREALTEEADGYQIEAKALNEVLNAAIETEGTVQTSMLMRGLHGALELGEKQPGDLISLGAISSFTTSRRVADSFASWQGVVLEIAPDQKAKALSVGWGSEDECLLQDAKFRVVGRRQSKDRVILRLEYA